MKHKEAIEPCTSGIRKTSSGNYAVIFPNRLVLATTLVIGLSQALGVSCVQASVQRNRAEIGYPRRETSPAPRSEFVTAAVLQPPLTELATDLEPLRTDFNRNASSIRLLLILSPS